MSIGARYYDTRWHLVYPCTYCIEGVPSYYSLYLNGSRVDDCCKQCAERMTQMDYYLEHTGYEGVITYYNMIDALSYAPSSLLYRMQKI